MHKNKLVFRSYKLPESRDVSKEHLASLIKEGTTITEHFGGMVDRPADYEYYAELGDLMDEISIIMFYFDTEEEIIYSETDPKQYAIDLLAKEKIHILSDGKDIDVFLELE